MGLGVGISKGVDDGNEVGLAVGPLGAIEGLAVGDDGAADGLAVGFVGN